MKYSRCQNCGGEQKYKVETGTLICERCGSAAPVNEDLSKPVSREYTPTFSVQNIEANQYVCDTCGAKIVVGHDGEVKRCASCGSTSLKKITSTVNTPDGIIPFTIAKDKAGEIFRSWVGSRKFAPSDLKTMAKLHKISGLYVPVWNFGFTSTFRYSAVGIKKKVDSDGHEEFYDYPVDKIKDETFNDVTRSASSKFSETYLHGLDNYDFTKLRPFSTDYLLGFSGLDSDIDIHESFNKITEDIASDNENAAREKLRGEYYNYESFSCRTRYRDVMFNYAYVPVWANHYEYKGKLYHCYINGQTGKAVGKAPKSFWKIAGLVLGALLGVGAIVLTIMHFI